MSNLREVFKGMRLERPPLNPYATPHAAEVLAAEGKHADAALVRQEVDPTDEQAGMDPLDFWLEVEEYERLCGLLAPKD
jgi:hypothetical protein